MLAQILTLDVTLSNYLRVAEQPGWLRSSAAVLAHSGDSWFWFAGLALVWWQGSPEWKDKAIRMAVGILITAALVMALKYTIRRRRPDGKWGSIYRRTDPHSFPSGHAARAAMLAMLATGLGPGWLAAIILVWAPLVGLARVAMGVHYLSDVIGGMLLGLATGLLVLYS